MDNIKKACALIILAECTKKKKRKWDNKLHLKFTNVDKRLRLTVPDAYLSIMHMPRESYSVLLNMVSPLIKKNNTKFRQAVSAHERLSITLQYLATGSSIRLLSMDSPVGRSTISCILHETCEAIVTTLRDCIQLPNTPAGCREIATQFSEKWNFFNCLGAIIGKHIPIWRPSDDGEKYLNYMNFHSIILSAVIGANYEFLHVDMNMCVSDRDAILGGLLWQMMYVTNEIQLPEPEAIPATVMKLPYAFVTEEAVPLTKNILKPYTNANLSVEQEHFNEQIRRALQVSENAFRLLTKRFGVLSKPISMEPKKAAAIALACCYLHNFLLKNNKADYVSNVAVEPIEDILPESVQSERSESATLAPLQKSINHLVYGDANIIRDKYMIYYNTIGAVEIPS